MVFSEAFESIRSILASIQIADIFDIIVVALLFYFVIVRLLKTSTFRVIIAVALFFVLTLLTNLFNMRMSYFLLTNITEIGIIALVILFQPELRRALDRVGAQSVSLITSKRNDFTSSSVDIAKIVSACESMSREHTGALLVIERDYALDDYFKTGTVIDAEISTELIRNLFFTKASLHDGAVIIRNGRIAAAGCVLPLTENKAVSSDLGTRHRAGMGMSEVSDALVVIVSEETGGISIAVDGMLKQGFSPDMLRRQLTTELHLDKDDSHPGAGEKLRSIFRSGRKEDDCDAK